MAAGAWWNAGKEGTGGKLDMRYVKGRVAEGYGSWMVWTREGSRRELEKRGRGAEGEGRFCLSLLYLSYYLDSLKKIV